MNYSILQTYHTLMDCRKQKAELELQKEELLDSSFISRLKFYMQSDAKKKLKREWEQRQLESLIEQIKQCELNCCQVETWLRNKSIISERMFLCLVKFLLSEYEHSEVLIKKRNIVNDLTREEILSLIRSNAEFYEYSYDYYQFLLVDAKEVYELPIKDKYNPLFYAFDMETGAISERVTMGHPKLAQGIMEFLNYRIEHCEINADDILESFQEYYKNELKKFTKVKS